MRVPVRRQPETRIGEQQQGYARPVQPLDTAPISHLIEGFRDQLLDEQDARQRIELNRRLITEVNELQADFAARQTDPNVSPVGFAKETEAAYSARHTALMAELRRSGYSQDLLDDFDNRLATVRSGFVERGLVHQVAQLSTRAGEEIEDIGLKLSQYVAADPTHNYETARTMLDDAIRTHPDLTDTQRAALRDQQRAVILDGGSRALRIMDPQGVVNLLDPEGRTAPYPTTTTTPAAPTEGGAISGPRDGNPARVPRGQRAVALEGNNSGGIEDGPFARRQPGYVGNNGRYAAFNTLQDGVNAQKALLHSYVSRGFDTPQKIAERWAPRGVDGNDPDTYARNIARTMGIGVNDRIADTHIAHFAEAQAHQENHNFRPSTTTAAADEAPAFRPAPVEAVGGGGGGGGGGAAPVAGEQTAAAEPVPASPGQAPVQSDAPPTNIDTIQTGNPLIDALNGPQRMELLVGAREQLNRVTAAQRAQMDVTIQNITAEALTNGGEVATPMPTEQQVLQTYGPVEGPQRWAQLQTVHGVGQAMVAFRTQSAETIQQSLDRLKPVQGSPTYAAQLQVYQHAEQAAQTLLAARQQNPVGYVMQYFPAVREAAQHGTAQYYAALDRAYQTLGIDPRTAPVMTPEASQQLTQSYRSMTPAQRLQFMMQNMTEMGEERFQRFTRGMEGTTVETDARIYALLRDYPGAARTGNLYNQILEGREMIAQDPAKRPREADVTEVFRSVGLTAVRDLNARASGAIQQAAEGLYVQRGGDPVHINRTLYREALQAVLGGNLPADMRRGQVPDYTILPPGVNEQQFRSWIERQNASSLTIYGTEHQPPLWGDLRTRVPVQNIIDEGVFVMVSPGYYAIRMASDGRPLMTSNGNRYLIRIDPQGLIHPSAGRPAAPPAPPRRGMSGGAS